MAAAEVLEAAPRAGARRTPVLVQQMAGGAEVLVGAVVDERFGAMVTARPGGALAEAGEAVFVPCPLMPRRRPTTSTSTPRPVGSIRPVTTCGPRPSARGHRAGGPRPPRTGSSSLEANPLLVDAPGRGRGRRARGSPAGVTGWIGLIFGLLAAVGWGLADSSARWRAGGSAASPPWWSAKCSARSSSRCCSSSRGPR